VAAGSGQGGMVESSCSRGSLRVGGCSWGCGWGWHSVLRVAVAGWGAMWSRVGQRGWGTARGQGWLVEGEGCHWGRRWHHWETHEDSARVWGMTQHRLYMVTTLWLKPTGNLWWVRCFCRLANLTPHPTCTAKPAGLPILVVNPIRDCIQRRIHTTMIVARIVARDDAHDFRLDVGTSHQKRRFNYLWDCLRPNLIYKILFLRNHNSGKLRYLWQVPVFLASKYGHDISHNIVFFSLN